MGGLDTRRRTAGIRLRKKKKMGELKRRVRTGLRRKISLRIVELRKVRTKLVRRLSQILTLVRGCWFQEKRVWLEMDGPDRPLVMTLKMLVLLGA